MRDKESYKNVSMVMRAGRKNNNLQQTDIADLLSLTQSTISKFERGDLVPTAPEWIAYCNLVNIPYSCLESGIIDHFARTSIMEDEIENGFKLPAKYSNLRGISVRSVLPIINFLKYKWGDETVRKYLKKMKIDLDYFTILDNLINYNLYFDLYNIVVENHLLNEMNSSLQFFTSQDSQGRLHEEYVKCKSSLDIVKTWVEHSKYYQCYTSNKIIKTTGDSITLKINHVEKFKKSNFYKKDIKLPFCTGTKTYLENISRYNKHRGIYIQEKDCAFAGADNCTYNITMR